MREVDDDALRREKARARELRQTSWWRRRDRDRALCHYCRRAVGAKALTLDHVVPARARAAARSAATWCPRARTATRKKQSLLAWEWEAYLDSPRRPAAES